MVLPEGAPPNDLRVPRFAVFTEHVEIYLFSEVETDDEWESGTQICVPQEQITLGATSRAWRSARQAIVRRRSAPRLCKAGSTICVGSDSWRWAALGAHRQDLVIPGGTSRDVWARVVYGAAARGRGRPHAGDHPGQRESAPTS